MSATTPSSSSGESRPRRKYVPAVTPRLRIALVIVFALFALLLANSVYLAGVTTLEAWTGSTYQDYFYLVMFLMHLVLGFLLLAPFIVFAFFHLVATRKRKNKTAVRMGYALLAVCLVLLFSGVLLTRITGVFELKQAMARQLVYWAHVIAPLVAMWLYWLHRLAGPPIKWRVGLTYGGVVALVVVGMLVLKAQDPQKWATAGAPESVTYFEPSLARTRDEGWIDANVLMNDQYCLDCHQDIHEDWTHSAHHLSSFNNPTYLTSVSELRDDLMERDGTVKASRWCAGCHDPVPFFSGKFDNPDFDMLNDPTAHAGITCTVCHSITHVNSTRGNSDYTIEAPIHYPFAYSDNEILKWVNRQLVKAKPSFHKQVMLKPLHKSADFCATCHKVHLPKELTQYKDFLRGQNHFDSYWLSGVSGKGTRSFYYPPMAQTNCNECHMPMTPSEDFGARLVDGEMKVHDHLFPSANTGLAWLNNNPEVIERHTKFNEGVMRVDIFGIKEGDDVAAPLVGPLRPEVPTLKRGESYLLETVIRTVKMGHHFTQGTVDSNEVWLDVTVIEGAEYNEAGERIGGQVVGRSGGLGEHREVDPWSHFVNVFLLDREGNRINRRNAHDIFVPLYNHQMPPGAGQVAHYALQVPQQAAAPITVEVKLQYRKFDQEYMNIVANFHREQGLPLRGAEEEGEYVNQLPIMTLAADSITFPVEGVAGAEAVVNAEREIPTWQRWNDYGIGLLLESQGASGRGELKQAAEAFAEVEKLGQFHGPINLARVYNADAQLDLAIEALERAVAFKDEEGYPAWTVFWLTGLINRQQNYLDQAITNFRDALEYQDEGTVKRKFDFSGDYVVRNELALTLFERAMQERGAAREASRRELLEESLKHYELTLELDSENAAAHYGLSQVYGALLGLSDSSEEESELWSSELEEHRVAHARYKPDDNARDKAVAAARARYPAANQAAEGVVIYGLQREGAFELPNEAAVSANEASQESEAAVGRTDADESAVEAEAVVTQAAADVAESATEGAGIAP